MPLFNLENDFSSTDSALVWLTVTYTHHNTCPITTAQLTHLSWNSSQLSTLADKCHFSSWETTLVLLTLLFHGPSSRWLTYTIIPAPVILHGAHTGHPQLLVNFKCVICSVSWYENKNKLLYLQLQHIIGQTQRDFCYS